MRHLYHVARRAARPLGAMAPAAGAPSFQTAPGASMTFKRISASAEAEAAPAGREAVGR